MFRKLRITCRKELPCITLAMILRSSLICLSMGYIKIRLPLKRNMGLRILQMANINTTFHEALSRNPMCIFVIIYLFQQSINVARITIMIFQNISSIFIVVITLQDINMFNKPVMFSQYFHNIPWCIDSVLYVIEIKIHRNNCARMYIFMLDVQLRLKTVCMKQRKPAT